MSKWKKSYKKVKKKRNIFADVPILVSVIFIIFGIVLGSIFAYNFVYLGEIINREDAISIIGTFDSYKYHYSPKSGSVTEVQINFVDRDSLYLDAYNVEMDEKFEALEYGQQLEMLLHPNSEYIWEMTSEDGVILSFEDAKSYAQLNNGFFGGILAAFCFICASMGVISLLVKYKEYKKIKNNKCK